MGIQSNLKSTETLPHSERMMEMAPFENPFKSISTSSDVKWTGSHTIGIHLIYAIYAN